MFVNKYLIVKPLSAYLKQKNSVTEFLRFITQNNNLNHVQKIKTTLAVYMFLKKYKKKL